MGAFAFKRSALILRPTPPTGGFCPSCTACPRGWWFICPLIKDGIACNRRVLKLYIGGGKYFGCRHCYELTYQSCQKHDARVDRLCEDPVLLRQLLKSKDWSQYTLALKALFKRSSSL